ncbi:CLUMA_CG010592, isoform A, partial [Clunio marinus]
FKISENFVAKLCQKYSVKIVIDRNLRNKVKKISKVMKFLSFLIFCVFMHATWAGDDKQIHLEDIERDTLISETDRSKPQDDKEQSQQSTQHIQLSYSKNPQDIFVTPMPGRHASKDSPSELRSQLYHLPKVHESDQTYTVPAKQTLIHPIIGGSQPIQPVIAPQPQYIYIQSPQAHQSFLPQPQAFVMVPYATQYTQHQSPIHVPQHSVLSQPQIAPPTPAVINYSHGSTSPPNHHQSYQNLKSVEYSLPSTAAPLQTSVDYKHVTPITIVPKKTLPSVSTTSFQQFYSPGLEYHYTESLPVTKYSPQQTFTYQQAPAHNYIPQSQAFNYYHVGPSAAYNTRHQSHGFMESYVPNLMTYSRPQHHHQSSQYKNNYHPTQYQQSHHHIPQQLFTPTQIPHYAPYPSPQAYNTIQYSVPLPAYDHSKRSTSKATATLSVKAPKAN